VQKNNIKLKHILALDDDHSMPFFMPQKISQKQAVIAVKHSQTP
jgi:hypothetical protein